MQNFYAPVPSPKSDGSKRSNCGPGNPAVVHHSIANVVSLPEGTKIVNGKAVAPTARPPALNSQSARETGGLSESRSREESS